MKRWPLVLLMLWPALAGAANKYVDASCVNNGNGTANSCAASGGGNGAWNSIANALGSWACGDTVNVNPGTYRTDRWNITNSCTSPSPLIIQRTGWTTDDLTVAHDAITESVKTLTSSDWTRCSDCTLGSAQLACRGAGGTCSNNWFHTKSGDGSNRTYWATKPDGSFTPVVTGRSVANLSAQYDAAFMGACIGGTNANQWCASLSDCPDQVTSGVACNKDGVPTIVVNWGSALPADPSVNFSNNGNQWFCNGCAWVFVRGLTIRRGIRAALSANSTAHDVTFEDNVLKYFSDSGNGSARPFEVDSGTNINLIANEIAYSSSEAVHVSTLTDGTVSGTISKNWIHNIGDVTVLGPGTGGTPNCTTFTNDASSGNPTNHLASPWDTGDDTGEVFDGNFLDTCNERDPAKGTYGIYLESTVKNLLATNNLVRGVSAMVEIRPAHSTPINGGINGINNNDFTNNFGYGFVLGIHDSAGECFSLEPDGNSSPAAAINGNRGWNNTCMDVIDLCIRNGSGTGLGNTTTNTFANNICQKATLSSPTNFLANNTTTGITVKNNVVWSGKSSGQCAVVGNSVVNCGATGCEYCSDPLTVNPGSHDYHIQSGSPAKDTGTATGMPSTRTRDVNNTIASAHSLPSYADNQVQIGSAWDIGADEQGGTGTPSLTLTKSATPNPVLVGSNITYTLAYSNIGTGGVTGAVITDTVPANTTFVSATGGGSLGGGVVTWTIGSIGAGASGSVQLVVQVSNSITPGTAIQNVTYALATNELATITGTTITTATNPPSTQFIYPATQRPNTWPQPQTYPKGITSDAAACPSTCAPPLLCANTTPALCFCSSTNTYTKISGAGTCP